MGDVAICSGISRRVKEDGVVSEEIFFFFLGNFQEVLSEERSGKLYKLVGEEGSGY